MRSQDFIVKSILLEVKQKATKRLALIVAAPRIAGRQYRVHPGDNLPPFLRRGLFEDHPARLITHFNAAVLDIPGVGVEQGTQEVCALRRVRCNRQTIAQSLDAAVDDLAHIAPFILEAAEFLQHCRG